MRAAARLMGVAPLLLLLSAHPVTVVPTAFRFEPDASPQLHQLWNASVGAKAERVACLAAITEGDTVRISDVYPLGVARSDSLGVSARGSLDTCGPPRWQGTVHTHVALREGRPYSLFSGADRGVMMMWWQQWRAEGVFCLLYTEQDVICEIEGPDGAVLFPRSVY
jgi:hypothetical protein